MSRETKVATAPPLWLSSLFGALTLAWAAASHGRIADPTSANVFLVELAILLGASSLFLARGEVEDKRGFGGGLVLALFALVLCMEGTAYLPAIASAKDFGAGPLLRIPYLILPLPLAAFALAGGRFTLPQRALAMAGIWITGNGKLFHGSLVPGFALVLGALLFVAVILSQGESIFGLWKRWCSAFGRFLGALFLILPLWWLLAGYLGDDQGVGLRVGIRLVIPAVLAVTMVRSLDRRGETCLLGGLMLGLLIALVQAAVGAIEASGSYPWSVVLGSRLRVLGLHPNLGGALLAMGLPLALAWSRTGKGGKGAQRVLGLALFLGTAFALYQTGSRTSIVAGTVGAAFLYVLLRFRTKQRFAWVLPAGAVAAVLGLALFASPLGDPVRDRLDSMAQSQSGLGQRWHIWKMAWDATLSEPITGVGPLSFHALSTHAQPSYFDGTSQTLHTHNILLAASAGAGFVGLGIFIAWCLGIFEFGRRVLLREKGSGRILPAALVSTLVVLALCSQLDLGQSQVSFLPMFVWVCLGVLASRLSGTVAARESHAESTATYSCLGVLLWPAMGSTLLGFFLLASGNADLNNGAYQKAQSKFELAAGPFGHVRPGAGDRALAKLYQKTQDREAKIGVWKAAVDARPLHAASWYSLAEAQMSAGQFGKAGVAIDRALALDPRGLDTARMWMLAAHAALEAGDGSRARTSLEHAIGGGQGLRLGMPMAKDASGGITFQVKGKGKLPLATVVDAVGKRMVATGASDPVASRRLMVGLVQACRENNDLNAALAWAQKSYDALATPPRSNFVVIFDLLRELDRESEALAAWAASPFAKDEDLAKLFGSGESQAAEQMSLDLFFTAGDLHPYHLAAAQAHLENGDYQAAQGELKRSHYNALNQRTRFETTLAYLATLQSSESGDEHLLQELTSFYAELKAVAQHKSPRHQQAIADLLQAEYGDDSPAIEAAALELTGQDREAAAQIRDSIR